MRKFLLALLVTTLALIVFLPPQPAASYKIEDAPRWESGHLTWYSLSPRYRDEMRQVASVINKSGINASLREAKSAASADILIERPGNRAPCEGLAFSSWRGQERLQSRIMWSPCNAAFRNPHLIREARHGTIRLLLHEVLHAYGLDHQAKGCALMNTTLMEIHGSYIPQNCLRGRQIVGQSYCRYIEVDDLRGLRALYGGKIKKLPRINCPRKAPRAPVKYTYTRHGNGITLNWIGADRSAPFVGIWAVRTKGKKCPARTDLGTNRLNVYGHNEKGQGSAYMKLPRKGRYCLFISSSLRNGYTGPPKRLIVRL